MRENATATQLNNFLPTRASGYRRNSANGFSLLEVLIALVILSAGLLGIAALVSSSLKTNDSAYMRSQATALAYNIIDRMRTNLTTAASGGYDLSMGYTPPAADSTTCYANSCAQAQLAQYDLGQWEYELNSLLPQGQGAITATTNAGITTVSVTVQWNDLRANAVMNHSTAPTAVTSSITINTAL